MTLIIFLTTEGELPQSGKRSRPEACASEKFFSLRARRGRPVGGKARSGAFSRKSGNAAAFSTVSKKRSS